MYIIRRETGGPANRLNIESSLTEKREHLSSLLLRKVVSHSSKQRNREKIRLVGEIKHTKVNTLKRTLVHEPTLLLSHESIRIELTPQRPDDSSVGPSFALTKDWRSKRRPS